MKRIIFIVVCMFSIIAPAIASAEGGKYVAIGKGKPAPFAGYLLNEMGLAMITAKAEMVEKVCKVKIDHEKKLAGVQIKKAEAIYKSDMKNTIERYESVIKIKNEQLIKMEGLAKERKVGFMERLKNSSFWTGTAIGIGLGMVVSTAVVLVATRK